VKSKKNIAVYRAFRLEEFEWRPEWVKAGQQLFEKTSKAVLKDLKSFVSEGKIDGSRLRDHWFPAAEADVFISHSHKDRNQAFALAGWLADTFSLKSFIDSTVWGYSGDLLRRLDNEHCLNNGRQTYSYELRNVTTSHVHMMLATALSRVMDATECMIFVSSPNSVSHSEGEDALVASPWIFYELDQLAILRRRIPRKKLLKEAKETHFGKRAAQVPIRYKANFKSLEFLSAEDLAEWSGVWENEQDPKHPLDVLYGLAGVSEK
jgi:hypothetical protein